LFSGRKTGPERMPALSNQSSTITFAQAATGTVRRRFPFPTKSGTTPARVAELEAFDVERCQLGAAQAAADQQGEERAVAAANGRRPVRGIQQARPRSEQGSGSMVV
jgi:hypothetical protein